MLRPRRPLHYFAIGLGSLILLFGAYVVSVFIQPIDLPWQQTHETLTAAARVNGHTVRVTGTTTLPDGSLIDYYFVPDPPDQGAARGGQTTVVGGRFAFEADLTHATSGSTQAVVSFSCDWGSVQPKPATDVVGEHCEHLAGDQVYVDSPGDPKQLIVDVQFVAP